MRTSAICFLASLTCLLIAIYAMHEGHSKLFSGFGAMSFCLLGVGIGNLCKNNGLKGNKTATLIAILLLALINIFVLYLVI